MSKGRPRKQYELHINGEYKQTGYINDLADVVGMKSVLLRKRVNKEMSGVLLKPIESKPPEYAFYKGEDGPFIGTLADISDMTGITERMIEWYGRPSAMERHDTALIKLEDDEMRVRRTNDKYAPILTEEKYNPKPVEKIIISKPVEPAEFKVGSYAQSLHDSYFAKWNLKEVD